MNAGISTACFYNMNLEDAFLSVAKCGAKTAEIFVNSHSEFSAEVMETMLETQKNFGIDVVSIHPYSCAFEPMMMYTNYERRMADFIEYYKFVFDYANKFGAKFIVMHGNKPINFQTPEFVAERFGRLQDEASKFGVSIVQENIVRNTSKDISYLKNMVKQLGDKAKFVLDLKQAHRSGYDPIDFVRELGDNIKHIHYSDYGKKGDCLMFGEGEYDNDSFFTELKSTNYSGNVILELYSNAYSSLEELAENYSKLDKYLRKF